MKPTACRKLGAGEEYTFGPEYKGIHQQIDKLGVGGKFRAATDWLGRVLAVQGVIVRVDV